MKKLLSALKWTVLVSCICLIPFTVWAVEPELVTTFNSVSIIWNPVNKDCDPNGGVQTAKVQYRTGGGAWNDAQDLWCDARQYTLGGAYKVEYRGSIVNLSPNTNYEIKLTLAPNGETATSNITTWSETFPEGTTVKIGNITGSTGGNNYAYQISTGGTANAYRVYDCEGNTIDSYRVDAYGISISPGVSYIIIRNCTITNATDTGIRWNSSSNHDIVIEDNHILNFGAGGNGTTQDKSQGHKMGIRGGGGSVDVAGRFIIQRNEIGPPFGDSNAWDSPSLNSHPLGPQGIGFRNSTGNNVIRYNYIHGNPEHMYNDAMGYEDNFSSKGFPGPNSDIYGNYISHAWDDGIEAEGGGENVRIWNNYITDVYHMIALVVVDEGPLYAFRNVFNRSRMYSCDLPASPCYSDPTNSDLWKRGQAFKIGAKGAYGRAAMYVYHNTLLQEKPAGSNSYSLGVGMFLYNTNDGAFNVFSRNNIAHLSHDPWNTPRVNGTHFQPDGYLYCSNDIDYDLYTGAVGQNCSAHPFETHGIKSTPMYDPATLFDAAANEFSRALAAGSPGHDAGVVLPNFNDGYKGSGPDMGAVEHGSDGFKFGVEYSFQN